MQQISGPGQGPFTGLILLISGILRFVVISILGLLALILGLAAFIIIIIPLIIYLLITKRKFINVVRGTKTRFNASASARQAEGSPFTTFTTNQNFGRAPQGFGRSTQEEEVDIDIPAKEDK